MEEGQSFFYKNKPFWIMVYYGIVINEIKIDSVYRVLRNALIKMPGDYPYRGPKKYKENNYIYQNIWNGKIDRFSGEEKIIISNKLIYNAIIRQCCNKMK